MTTDKLHLPLHAKFEQNIVQILQYIIVYIVLKYDSITFQQIVIHETSLIKQHTLVAIEQIIVIHAHKSQNKINCRIHTGKPKWQYTKS